MPFAHYLSLKNKNNFSNFNDFFFFFFLKNRQKLSNRAATQNQQRKFIGKMLTFFSYRIN